MHARCSFETTIKKKLYASRGPRDIVELPRPDDELGIQLRSISRNSTNRASAGASNDATAGDDTFKSEGPPHGAAVVPKLRNSQKLRNSAEVNCGPPSERMHLG